jgi:hypothetical protein
MKKIPLLLLLHISFYSFSQIPVAGMIAGYSFTGNANDESGNGHNGTAFGSTLTAGKQGVPNTAYYFNGATNYIYVANAPSLTPAEISLCAIVKPQGYYTGQCQTNTILYKGPNDHVTGHYGLLYSDNPHDGGSCFSLNTSMETFSAAIGPNVPSYSVMAYTPVINLNDWYCVIATFNGDSISLYVDAVKKYTVYSPSPIGIHSHPLSIGANLNNSFPYWLKGIIDDVRIYNRVLTFDEIGKYCEFFNGEPLSVIEKSNKQWALYPNPASQCITLKLNSYTKNSEIKIYNMIDQCVLNISSINTDEIKINTSHFPPGMYFIVLKNSEEILQSKFIIE